MSQDKVHNSDLYAITTISNKVSKKGLPYCSVDWPRQKWVMFKNKKYNELITKWNKDRSIDIKGKPVQVRTLYKRGIHTIPFYHIYRTITYSGGLERIGQAFLHYDKNNNPYIVIPSVPATYNKPVRIGKTYFIYENGLTDSLDIIDGASLMMVVKGRVFTP